jgi:iron complex transport system ATP-binding protein
VSTIELIDLRVEVGGRTLVDSITLSVASGTWTTLVGPNGSGKTSLVEALVGVRRSSGVARVGGRDLRQLRERERARLVAFVPQHPTVPAGMSVIDYVGLGRTAHQGFLATSTEAGRGVVGSVLARLDLTAMAHRDVATLSGGERQRCVLARALAQESPVVVLDEPTTGLDVRHQVDTLELLRREVDERGVTVLATLHDLTLAGQFGERLALLGDGRVIVEGPAHDVLRAPDLSATYATQLRVIDVDGVDVVVPSLAPIAGRQRPPIS